MREIKFRAWDPFYKMMLRSETIDFKSLGCFFNEVKDREQNDVKVMQFIGLVDKNLKDIYEGDVLTNEGLYIIIEFSAGQFVGVYDKNGSSREIQNRNWLQWAVIGNIHEKLDIIKSLK